MIPEFLVDNFQEEDKRELDNVIKVIKQKPRNVDRNTVFLYNFTLSLLGQYSKPKRSSYSAIKITPEIEKRVGILKRVERTKEMVLQKKAVIQMPFMLKMDDFMPTPPKPFYLLENIPTPQLGPAPTPTPQQEKEIQKMTVPEAPKAQKELILPEPPKIIPTPSQVSIQQNNPTAPKPVTENSAKNINEAPKPI